MGIVSGARTEDAPAPAEKPAIPWTEQKEANWGDARRGLTDIGPFMNYALKLPDGTIGKALSIRLGEKSEAAAVFDAATLSWRACWTGNFLKFDAARYGLINWPRPDGTILLKFENAAQTGTFKYRGFYTRDNRVTVSYGLDGTEVLESPSIEKSDALIAFTRSIQVAASEKELPFPIGKFPDTHKLVSSKDGEVVLEAGENNLAFSVKGPGKLKFDAQQLSLIVPASKDARSVKLLAWSGPKADLAKFQALAEKSAAPEDVKALTQPAGKRWGEPIAVKGTRSIENTSYVVDTITIPYENPFKALFFMSGVDFLENGDALVSTLHGDVWLVKGIDDKLEKVTWQRFATGLFQPFGVKVVNNSVYVLGRDQVTILRDLNNDGEADFYECFNNGMKTSTGGHDYSAGLETDSAGNFYHIDAFGLHRISKDGTKYETPATGWRNPIAFSVGPNDVITASPQEGNWTPNSGIYFVKPGGFYGYGGPKITPERPLGYDSPGSWMPRTELDNSTGGQAWVTSDKWGMPVGSLLNLSFGNCNLQRVLFNKLESQQYQAAVYTLPMQFLAGSVRGRFRAQDGQFYVVGTRGWQTNAVRDGNFQRVRYTGQPLIAPQEFHTHTNGIRITFNEELDKEDTLDPGNFTVEQFNYKYAGSYGSKDYKVSEPTTIGRDPVDVKKVKLSADGRTVFIETPELKSVMQFTVKFALKTAAGKRLRGKVFTTIHQPEAAFTAQ
jgi:hypothetical protein